MVKKKILSMLFIVALLPGCGSGGCCDHDHGHGHSHGHHSKKTAIPGMQSMMQKFPGATMINGFAKVSEKKYDRLMVNGTARLHKVTVSNEIMVNGDLKAKQSIFKSLKVNGKASINSSEVTGDTAVSGFLVARNTTFADIVVAADKIILDESIAHNILIKDNDKDIQQVLELTGGVIQGTITFEKMGGKVIIKNGTDIRGSIIGAEA